VNLCNSVYYKIDTKESYCNKRGNINKCVYVSSIYFDQYIFRNFILEVLTSNNDKIINL